MLSKTILVIAVLLIATASGFRVKTQTQNSTPDFPQGPNTCSETGQPSLNDFCVAAYYDISINDPPTMAHYYCQNIITECGCCAACDHEYIAPKLTGACAN